MESSKYFKDNTFLHQKFAEELLEKEVIVFEQGKLHLKHEGKMVQDHNLIARSMLAMEPKLTMANINEVKNRLKLVATRIDNGFKASISPPILKARLKKARNEQLKMLVWCPYCRIEHSHGYDISEKQRDNETHRAAHCRSKASPFFYTGYIIKIDQHNPDNQKLLDKYSVSDAK